MSDPSPPPGDISDRLAENRDSWDRWADINVASDFYDVEGFVAGRSSLDEIEREGVGDVAGKRLLNLQCHFGMGTISWARLGATVTGVDFSPRAIELARALAERCGVDATFVCADVTEAAAHVDGPFDVVFTSYGAISWLPDLTPWAETIAALLAPGGVFFVADSHPTVWMFDDAPGAVDTTLRYKYPYFSRTPLREELTGNYADPASDVTTVTHSWQHTFEDIIGSLIGAGLRITSLREYDRIVWPWFDYLVRGDDGMWRMPPGAADIPLMFSVTATRD